MADAQAISQLQAVLGGSCRHFHLSNGSSAMMGVKTRVFRPMLDISLEDLVPADNFYRHVERTLDLSFVRDLVRDRYSAFGRPSIDPVVFFKLQLVMFFEGMRSERQLERVGADRLSVRWYLGYDLDEPLPDHSSMTRIRERHGIAIFRRFFEAIVEPCREAGLVWGKELYADCTLVDANAHRDKMQPHEGLGGIRKGPHEGCPYGLDDDRVVDHAGSIMLGKVCFDYPFLLVVALSPPLCFGATKGSAPGKTQPPRILHSLEQQVNCTSPHTASLRRTKPGREPYPWATCLRR
jgi:transposase